MNKHKLILFDGVCNFCNFWVNFVIDKDKNDNFRFTAMQSEKGQEILKKFGLNTVIFDSFYLIDSEKIFDKSTAVLLIAKELKSFVKILYPLIFIPKFLRDFLYSFVAKNRYKIFGKREACRIPTVEEKRKFL